MRRHHPLFAVEKDVLAHRLFSFPKKTDPNTRNFCLSPLQDTSPVSDLVSAEIEAMKIFVSSFTVIASANLPMKLTAARKNILSNIASPTQLIVIANLEDVETIRSEISEVPCIKLMDEHYEHYEHWKIFAAIENKFTFHACEYAPRGRLLVTTGCGPAYQAIIAECPKGKFKSLRYNLSGVAAVRNFGHIIEL